MPTRHSRSQDEPRRPYDHQVVTDCASNRRKSTALFEKKSKRRDRRSEAPQDKWQQRNALSSYHGLGSSTRPTEGELPRQYSEIGESGGFGIGGRNSFD